MGMFDGLLGQLAGSLGGLSGQQSGLASSLLTMLTSGQQGGLAGLLQQFEQNGLGQLAQSWVGTGANLPVSPQQIQQVLGSGVVQQLAAQHGLDPQQVSGHLAQLLPALVDHMTPNGQLPQGGAGGLLGGLLGGAH